MRANERAGDRKGSSPKTTTTIGGLGRTKPKFAGRCDGAQQCNALEWRRDKAIGD